MSIDTVPESQPTSDTPESASEQAASPATDTVPAPVTESAHDSSAARVPEPAPAAPAEEPAEPQEDFAAILSQFEKSHTHKPASGVKQIEGTVVSLSADQVFIDIGYKTEGVLPRSAFRNNAESIKPGDTINVSVKGRNEEGYYDLTLFKVAQPRDWSALEAAFAEKLAVVGTVTAVIKGGVTVDIGVRAFMPASRSGTRDAAELEKMVGTEITCRITKLDVTDENVVVDRRVVLEEQARAQHKDVTPPCKQATYSTAPCAASWLTAHSSTSAASMACSTSATSRGAASTSLKTCSLSASKLGSQSSKSIRKQRRFRSA